MQQAPSNMEPPALVHEIISSDSLTYLPNLYFRKYKMVEKLSNLRYNFPEQRILITRKPTSWDLVIKEAKEKQRQMTEIKKFKIAEKYHLAKCMKDKTLKNDLKREELYLFHRIIASSLAEQVRIKFEQFVASESKASQADTKLKRDFNSAIKEQHPQGSNSINREYPSQHQNNDIFLDDGQQENQPQENLLQDDIFADMLKTPANPPPFIKQRVSSISQNGKNNGNNKFTLDGPDIVKLQSIQRGQSIVSYFKKYIDQATVRSSKKDEKMVDQNQKQAYSEIQELLHQKSLMVNRKLCLKKINNDLRKRNKNRGDSGQNASGLSRQASNLISNSNIQTKSFGSASVALNNLINAEPQLKPEEAIQIPSIIDPNIYAEAQKVKRKKQQIFQLKWSEQKMQELRQANPLFDPKKTKFNDPSLLALYLLKSQQDYHKLFEKSLKTKKNFPGHLKDIPVMKSIFSKDYRWTCQNVQNENIGEQFYYNQFYDREYELFIMNNSKQRLIQKFIKASDYIFPQNYSNESNFDDRNNNSIDPISIGKIFVNPNAYINRKNTRIIYKFHKNQLSAVIKSSSLSENIQNFSRNFRKIGRDHIILLSYLVRRYLSLYGNNWPLITECIRMNICFNHLLLTTEMIQQLYQYVELRRNTPPVTIIKDAKKVRNGIQIAKKQDIPGKFKRSIADRNQEDGLAAPAELMEIEDDNNFNNLEDDQFGLGSYGGGGGNQRNNYSSGYNNQQGPKISEAMKEKLKGEQRAKVQESLQSLGKIQLWEKKMLPFGIYTESSYQKSGQSLETYNFVDTVNENSNQQNSSNKQGSNCKKIEQQKHNSKKSKGQNKNLKNIIQSQQNQLNLINDSSSYVKLIRDESISLDNNVSRANKDKDKDKVFKKIEHDYEKYLKLVDIQQDSTNMLEDQKIIEQDHLYNVKDDFLKMQEENHTEKNIKSTSKLANFNQIGSMLKNTYVRNEKHFKIMQKYMPKPIKSQQAKLIANKLQKHVKSTDVSGQSFFAHKFIASNQQSSQSLHIHMHRTKTKKIVNEKTSELVRILQQIRKGQNNTGVIPMAGPGQGMLPPRPITNGMRPQGNIHTSAAGNILNVTLDPSANGARQITGNPVTVNPTVHNPNIPSSSVVNTGAPPVSADTQSVKGNKSSGRKPNDKDKNEQTPEKKSKPKKKLKKGDDKND